MARLSEVYKSKFIRATQAGTIECDIAGKDAYDIVLKVTRVTIGIVGKEDDAREQAILHFAGTEQTLGLNNTNARSMEAITGSDDTDDWAGAVVELFTVPVDSQWSKTGHGIRLRKPRGNKPAVTGEPQPEAPPSGPDAMPAAFANALLDKIKAKPGKTLDQLRAYLVGKQLATPAQVEKAVAYWPKSTAQHFKAWLELDPPAAAPTVTEDDIPF